MNSTEKLKHNTILNKYPSHRDDKIRGCWKWLQGRRLDDNAEGFWRVHNKLYNLTDFISRHPGGENWLLLTKGTDVTEAFETHHISPKAEQVLSKYFVRDATEPRNYNITFEENGFYKTLKRRVHEKLSTIDKSSELWKSKIILDCNLIAFLITTVIAFRSESMFWTLFWGLLAGQFVAWMANISHNFIHQPDNWRMYTANITFLSWRDFRVFHTMSHHMYPNTYADLEISLYEPHFLWIPLTVRSKLWVIYSKIMTPIVYMLIFQAAFIFRMLGAIWSQTKVIYWDEMISLTIPLLMIIFGKQSLNEISLSRVYFMWTFIIETGSLLYGLFSINNGHHGPKMVHEGDEIESVDFGILQLRTTVDRVEMQKNIFVVLSYFGDHVLHHLFPSLDHTVLPHLHEVFEETCKEFKINNEKTTIIEAMSGQFKQLSRTETIKI